MGRGLPVRRFREEAVNPSAFESEIEPKMNLSACVRNHASFGLFKSMVVLEVVEKDMYTCLWVNFLHSFASM